MDAERFIFVTGHQQYAVDTVQIHATGSYRFLNGNPWAINPYRHDCLPGYNWVESHLAVMGNIMTK